MASSRFAIAARIFRAWRRMASRRATACSCRPTASLDLVQVFDGVRAGQRYACVGGELHDPCRERVQLLLPPHQFFAALRPTPLHFHDAVASLGQPPNLFR